MKKFLTLIIFTASTALLQANYYNSNQGYRGGYYYQDNSGYVPQGYYAPQGYQSQGYQYGQPRYPQVPQYGQPNYNPNYQGPQGYDGPCPQGMTNQTQYQSNTSGMQTSPSQMSSDQKMTNLIQDAIRSSTSNKYKNVHVRVNNGYATLTGNVATQDDKNALEQKVAAMSGIQGVDNQVIVQNKY